MAYFAIVISALCSALAGAFLKLGAQTKSFSQIQHFSDLFSFWPQFAAIGVYGLGFILYAYSLKHLALTTAYPTMVASATLFVIILGTLLFQENLSISKIFGLILIITGVFIVNR